MTKIPKKLKALDNALTDVYDEHPEIEKEGTALMDAACRAYGIDPDEERRKAAVDRIRHPGGFNPADYY